MTDGPLMMWMAQGSVEMAAPLTEHQVLVFLVQVLLLLGVARTLGAVMKRLDQPPVVGELLAGVILGPSLFGIVFPDAFSWVFEAQPAVNSAAFALAWLGVVFLLVVMGYETDLAIISRFKRVALSVAAGSLVVPMIVTGALGLALASRISGSADPPPWVFASFFALALSVSALPVVGKILADLGFLRRNFGQITLAAAMSKDAVGWLILSALSGVAVGGIAFGEIGVSFGGLAVFVIVVFTVGRRLLDVVFKFALAHGAGVGAGFSITVVAALAGGAVTQALHLEAIIGAYLVGLVLSRTRHQLPLVRDRLELVTGAFFAPVFFAFSGLRVDMTALASLETAAWAIAALVLAVSAKVVGTVISGRLVGVEPREAMALGAGLSPLGVMGVVVAIIGLNLGVLDETAYTILVLVAVVTSLIAPLLLKWAVGRWEPPAEETSRLQRESLRDEAEVLGASRVLLPTRGGTNTIYAARLVAAVFPDAEVTVLTVEIPQKRGPGRWLRRRVGSASNPDAVIEAMGSTSSRIVAKVAGDPGAAIIAESRLGYDLLVVGASRGDDGAAVLSSLVDRVLRETGIPTLIVQFPEAGDVPVELPRRILVPISSGRSSRAAEELGYSLAQVSGGAAIALHVIDRPDGEGVFLPGVQVESRAAAEALIAEAREFASRLGVQLEPELRVAPNAEHEILDFAMRRAVDLVVLGTSNRPMTNRPFFSHRISYMAERSPLPLAIVALPSFRSGS
jgi:Kef-type K+ transport system membrane component KefB